MTKRVLTLVVLSASYAFSTYCVGAERYHRYPMQEGDGKGRSCISVGGMLYYVSPPTVDFRLRRSLLDVYIPSTNRWIAGDTFSRWWIAAVVFDSPSCVELIGENAFFACKNLRSICIPSSVICIENSAFQDCTILGCLSFDQASKLTTIHSHAFDGCTSLTFVALPDSVEMLWTAAFSNCRSLTRITLGENLQRVGNNAFYNCSNLESIAIPQGVTSIGEGAFQDCHNLEAVTFAAESRLQEIGPAAFSKSGLLTVEIPTNVQVIQENTFADCSVLKNVTFAQNNRLTSVGDAAFLNCKALRDIIPETVVAVQALAFQSCTVLDRVTFGSNSSLQLIGNFAFSECHSLQFIELPAPLTTIGLAAFRDSALTSVTIPANVQQIGMLAFENCSSLTSVVFAPGSQLTEIKLGTFKNCSKLKSVTIPESVTTIASDAFEGCLALSEITVPLTPPLFETLKAIIGTHRMQKVTFDFMPAQIPGGTKVEPFLKNFFGTADFGCTAHFKDGSTYRFDGTNWRRR
ncbi:MAG: leucine-rich repeat domain-containing protein [Holosporales bacterium]|nr:leucine-rich repeat domain-containing protein [Holosporales bacterium]